MTSQRPFGDAIGVTQKPASFTEPFCVNRDQFSTAEALWGDSQMTAIARVLARRLPASQAEIETLKTIGMFCGVGLLVSLMLASYGLDLSPGFF
jgi:hypothetical protein